MMTLPTISASKIKTFRTCQRQFYYKYVLDRDDRPVEDKNIGALFGTAFHEAIEMYYRAGANPRLTFQNVMKETMDTWEDQNLTVKGGEWFGKSLKDGKLLLDAFDWARFDPVELEYEFSLPFPNAENPIAMMNGYIDMITTDARVVDHKSQRKLPTQDQMDNDAQFIIYAWAYLQLYGVLPSAVIWNDIRNHNAIVVDVLNDFEFKLQRLTQDIEALIAAEHYPRRQLDYVCLKECSFYTACYGLKASERVEEEDE